MDKESKQVLEELGAVKAELLQIQVEDAKFKLNKAKREDEYAQKEYELKLRLQKAQADKAEIDLENARREADLVKAEAQENLVYTFYATVGDDSVKSCLADLGKWTRRFPGKPLTITLNSPGGSVIAGLALYDYLLSLRKSGHEVTVIALGMAASMGGILLQAGNKRIIGRQAMLLIHEVSAGTIGKVSEMQDRIEFSKGLWNKLVEILSERSTLTARKIKSRANRKDWWLDAEEAVELGFADEIL